MLKPLTKQNKPTFFVTKNFSEKLEVKSDILLSPEFYWIKTKTLNLRYTHEAKKMAPAVFHGFLPKGEYEYKVFKKEKNYYIFVAYDISWIKNELNNLDIDMSLIDRIYLLQSEFIELEARVNDNYSLITLDGMIVYIPSKLLETQPSLHVKDLIEKKKLSSGYIYRSKSVQKATSYFTQVLSLLIFLNAFVLLNAIKAYVDKSDLEKRKEEFIRHYNLPQTTFQIDSIKGELSVIENKQNTFKEALFYLNSFNLLSGEVFESFEFKADSITFILTLRDKKREELFKSYVKKRLKIISVKDENKTIFIEVKL